MIPRGKNAGSRRTRVRSPYITEIKYSYEGSKWRRRESNCLGSAASVSYRFHVPTNCILRIQPRVVERARNVRRVTSASTLGYSSIMMKSVDAIYENGKLVLEQPLPLPEHAR